MTAAPQTAREIGVSAELYPWTGKRLDVGGAHMHYLDEGPREPPEGGADPVLMVHGNPSWSVYWRPLIKALSATHRCIVPDHIGMGLSDKPSDADYDYTLTRRIADLGKLVDHLQLDRPLTLIVHDWGGMIGSGWAVDHPEQVARTVILNTSAFAPSDEIRLPWQLKLARSPLGTALVQGFNAFAIGGTLTCTVKPMAADVKKAYTAPYDSFANRVSTLRFVQDIPLSDKDRAWDAVAHTDQGLDRLGDKPALICWGLKDYVFHGGFLAQWKKRWPHAEVHTWDDAGHYVLEDKPGEITALVRGFLAGSE